MSQLLLVVLVTFSIVVSTLSLIIAFKSLRQIKIIVKLLATYPRMFERISRKIEAKKKIRKRYLVFEILGCNNIDANRLDEEIRRNIISLLGKRGLIDTNYKLMLYDKDKCKGIIRANNKSYKILIGILGLIRQIDNDKVLIIPISIHGTLKKAYEKIGE